jgi:sensor domain CHASE-containing protein
LRGSTAVTGQVEFGITLSNNGNLFLTYAGSINIVDGEGRRVVQLPLTPASAYVVPNGQAPLAAVWKQTASLSGRYSAQVTLSILVNGAAVATLRSQSLAMNFSSGLPMAVVVGIGLAVLLLLVVVRWSARRAIRRRRLRSHAPKVSVRNRLA